MTELPLKIVLEDKRMVSHPSIVNVPIVVPGVPTVRIRHYAERRCR
jgi:hypothetical protein